MGRKKRGVSNDDVELDPLLSTVNNDEDVNISLQIPDHQVKKRRRKWKPFPFCIFFILGNEFCERYSYYGMRTILVLYLKYYLLWDANTATAVYHAFTVLAYLFPLLGAMIADSWWGKYNTILWLSIVYAIGMVINTLGAIGDLGDLTVHAVLSSVGLLVIAFGTGGIKPCVSAFGGDQFDVDQDDYRRSFFSLFYFAINAGSLISTFVSPIIREDVQCFGGDCYALAFGIPAILMIVAIISFFIGTRWYVRVPPAGNIFMKVSRTIYIAIKNRWNTPSKQRTKDHFMEYAGDGTTEMDTLIRDIRYVLNVLILFIPLPLFWALFDQQGSRWTLQAVRMDGYVGTLHILPDQMQICNPLMIVTLIPLFEVTLYPLLRKLNINFSPLRRMTAGMLLACLSFIVAALVQMMIDENLTIVPVNSGQTSLRIIDSTDCPLEINSNVYPEWGSNSPLQGYEGLTSGDGTGTVIMPNGSTNTLEDFVTPGTYSVNYQCQDDTSFNTREVTLGGEQVYDLIISNNVTGLKSLLTSHPIEKSDSGSAFYSVVNTLNQNITVDKQVIIPNIDFQYPEKNRGDYTLEIMVDGTTFERPYYLKTGGIYTLVVRDSNPSNGDVTSEDLMLDQYTDVYHNDVSIFWMIPQYFIITLGEVFLSVTGLEFAYSQAPPSMKSVLQSFWLFTVSIGNIIVLIVAEARLVPSQADEYFLFAGLIGVAALLFIILAMRYEYVDESLFDESGEDTSQEDESSLTKEDLGKSNVAYDHNTEL